MGAARDAYFLTILSLGRNGLDLSHDSGTMVSLRQRKARRVLENAIKHTGLGWDHVQLPLRALTRRRVKEKVLCVQQRFSADTMMETK